MVTNSITELPNYFVSEVEACYGAEEAARVFEGCHAQRKTTLRANALLSSKAKVASSLDAAGIAWQPVSWYDDAFVLSDARKDALWALPAYNQGEFYVQSLSSMLPPLVLAAQEAEDICDFCAAPGGKTTQIAALTAGKAYITACEMHEPRAQKLDFNLQRQGAKNVTVMRTDARNLDEFFSFDRILVDAPCSGSGTLLTSNQKKFGRFTPKLVEKSIKSQRALLKKGLSLLRPGGTLVYSTCSILHAENEQVVRWALEQVKRVGTFELQPLDLPDLTSDGADLLPTEMPEALCLCPNELYEGFFLAKIKRVQ